MLGHEDCLTANSTLTGLQQLDTDDQKCSDDRAIITTRPTKKVLFCLILSVCLPFVDKLSVRLIITNKLWVNFREIFGKKLRKCRVASRGIWNCTSIWSSKTPPPAPKDDTMRVVSRVSYSCQPAAATAAVRRLSTEPGRE